MDCHCQMFFMLLLCWLRQIVAQHSAPAAGHTEPMGLLGIFEARNLEFSFPTLQERQRVLNEGLYNPDSVIPLDVDVYYKQGSSIPNIFVTIPRFTKGVPYSLAFVTNEQGPNGTMLEAYPSYNWHNTHGGDCNGLTSVYRTCIDECDRMWILDSGEIDFVHYCAPQLYAIDLQSGKVAHQYRMPPRLFKMGVSRFVMPTIELNADSCDVGHVYMADSIGAGIVVYDVTKQQSWRIENKYTYPHPDFGTFHVAGDSFELWDGTVALTVTPRELGIPRMLYFHSLSSDWQMAIPLHLVNNGSNWMLNDVTAVLDQFKVLGKRGSQCVGTAMSETGTLLCGLVQPSGILGWNIRTPYTRENLIVLIEDEERLQFPSGVKIVRNNEGKEEVWILSNRLQKAFGTGLNYKDINFRIQKCGVQEFLSGTTCF